MVIVNYYVVVFLIRPGPLGVDTDMIADAVFADAISETSISRKQAEYGFGEYGFKHRAQ